MVSAKLAAKNAWWQVQKQANKWSDPCYGEDCQARPKILSFY
jgi:hypothetical protein